MKLKNKKILHVKRVSNVTFLSSIRQIEAFFVHSLCIASLKLCKLSKVGLSTINTVKSHTVGRRHLNQKHIKMSIVCMSLLTKGVQNVHHLHEHMLGDAFSIGQLQCR